MRRCVVTRRRHPASSLVRIVARDGALHLAGSEDRGRGAWVVPTREALERLESTPGMAWRTLRVSGVPAGPLLDEVRAETESLVENALRRCVRSGLVRPADGAGDPGTVAVAVVGAAEPVVLCAALVERAMGKAPASGYQVDNGRPSRTLAALLRRLVGLG